MKFTFQIDKPASLIAGIDPVGDVLTFDIPAANIPEEVRATVVSGLQGETLKPVYRDSGSHGWTGGQPDPLPLKLVADASEADALALIIAWVSREQERQAWYDNAVAAKVVKDKAAQEEQAAIDAEWRCDLLAGLHEITQGDSSRVTLKSPDGALRTVTVTPEIAEKAETWRKARQAEAAAKSEVEAKARRRIAERKDAAAVAGQPVHEWDIEQGAIDISVEPGIPYGQDHRARNWVATVSFSPSSPGNLDRHFWDGKGKMRLLPGNLAVGDYLEGGSKDKKDRKTSEYVRVLEITDTTVTVREAKKPSAKPPSIEKEVGQLHLSRAAVLEVVARHAAEEAGEQQRAPPAVTAEPKDWTLELIGIPTEVLEAELTRRASA